MGGRQRTSIFFDVEKPEGKEETRKKGKSKEKEKKKRKK